MSVFCAENYSCPSDVYTLALVDQGEDRKILEKLFEKLNAQLEDIAASPICGDVNVEFHFCSDWKFLAIVLGVNAANAVHFCPFCTTPKQQRRNNLNIKDQYIRKLEQKTDSKGNTYYQVSGSTCFHCDTDYVNESSRGNKCYTYHHDDLGDFNKCSKKSSHGVVSTSLLSSKVFSMERIWIDVLHSFLRMTDILQDALIAEMEKHNRISEFQNQVHLQCNLIWRAYYKYDEKTEKQSLEFPTLDGNKKKKLLRGLRDFSPLFDRTESRFAQGEADTVNYDEYIQGWKDMFQQLSDIMNFLNCPVHYENHNNCSPISEDKEEEEGEVDQIYHTPQEDMGALIDAMNDRDNCGLKCNGHSITTIDAYSNSLQTLKSLMIDFISPNAIKSYFHLLEGHAVDQITSPSNPFGSIAPFSCSAQELKNRCQTLIQFKATNQHDVIFRIILFEHLQLWYDSHEEKYSKEKQKGKNTKNLTGDD